MQGPELEKEFGNGASLFLTRICAYLRTVNMTGGAVGLALQAISVFVGAASGHRCPLSPLPSSVRLLSPQSFPNAPLLATASAPPHLHVKLLASFDEAPCILWW